MRVSSERFRRGRLVGGGFVGSLVVFSAGVVGSGVLGEGLRLCCWLVLPLFLDVWLWVFYLGTGQRGVPPCKYILYDWVRLRLHNELLNTIIIHFCHVHVSRVVNSHTNRIGELAARALNRKLIIYEKKRISMGSTKSTDKELIGHCKVIEDRLFESYANLKKPDICKKCGVPKDINEGHPVSFFVVGKDFPTQQFKIMFVGKTVQNNWEDNLIDNKSGFLDARYNTRESLFLPFWSTGSFFQCIKEVCQYLWETNNPDEIWRRISITDLVKCSNSESEDETTPTMISNCQKSGFFLNEVKIVKPTHIIFFTGNDYDDYIRSLDFGKVLEDKSDSVGLDEENVKSRDTMWWHKKFLLGNGTKMQFLRTAHPTSFTRRNNTEKENFCRLIAKWVESSIEN